MSSQDEFYSIVNQNGLADWYNNFMTSSLTLGDLYEGLTILSSMQADLHHFVENVIRSIVNNNKGIEPFLALPSMTTRQISYLVKIFELAEMFLEEPEID